MSVLKIDTVAVQAPKEMTWSLQAISSPDSGRTLDAVMHNEIVDFKVKLSCKWGPMTIDESSVLLKAVYSKKNFSVEYLDPMEGSYQVKTFYVGDRTAPKMIETESVQKVESVAFDFVEV